MQEPGGSGLPFYSRRARLRGLASADRRDTRRVAVGEAPCAAGAYPFGMQRQPSKRGAVPGVVRRIPIGRPGEARGRRAPPDSPMAAGRARALCWGCLFLCGQVFLSRMMTQTTALFVEHLGVQ
jgi:hypothetical protein